MPSNLPQTLVITPVKHIQGVSEILEKTGNVTYMNDPTTKDVLDIISMYDAVFTNPNKSDIYLGEEIFSRAGRLKVIATASTGTVHIDKKMARERGIHIISLTEERSVINKISSTAEHAFALTLAALRNIPASIDSVKNGNWDYEKFIGRQMDHLTVGVIGFGRLGNYFAHYARAFGSRVLVHDPYKDVLDKDLEKVDFEFLISNSDIISLHLHVTKETRGMMNADVLSQMKPDVILVNTSRGEICIEKDIIKFMYENPNAKYATDVLSDENRNKNLNPIIDSLAISNQIIVTPHIGGMTKEGQMIAYNHAAKLLLNYLEQ